jgi:pimeloyl-ACP methyl ester carboxylesterase
MLWISFRQNQTPEVASRLVEMGRMLNPADGSAFVPQPAPASVGTLVLAHGMRDGWKLVAPDGKEHWMVGIYRRVQERLGGAAPQMMVLDWRDGAKASSQYDLNTQDGLSRFLADVGGVRPTGQATGDFFGARLARMVEDGEIRPDRPLHLVGHSAGGFVVARAAHILVAMGFPKDRLHVTILDTPQPDEEIKEKVAGFGAAEFYRTSDLVQRVPMNPGLYFREIQAPAELNMVDAHRWAGRWYRDTIPAAKPGDDGFGRSPFCQ